MQNVTTLERAFALARSGTCANIDEIRATLKRERFDQIDAHLAGHSIKRQLRALCEAARASETADVAAATLPGQPQLRTAS